MLLVEGNYTEIEGHLAPLVVLLAGEEVQGGHEVLALAVAGPVSSVGYTCVLA